MKKKSERKENRKKTAGIFLVVLLTLAVTGICIANSMIPVSGEVSRAEMRGLYKYRGITMNNKDSVLALTGKLPYLSKTHKDFELGTDSITAQYAVIQNLEAQDLKNNFYRNGAILFALIEDLQSVKFRGNDKTELHEVSYRRPEFEERFGKNNTVDLASFEAFLKELDKADFARNDSILPLVLQEKLSKQNAVEVNRETTYRKTAVLKQNIIYNEPLLGISVNAEEIAGQFGYDLKEYYGKQLECYIYDTADGNNPASSQKQIVLSIVCEGKELYSMPLENDSQKQQVIKYINLGAERFLK